MWVPIYGHTELVVIAPVSLGFQSFKQHLWSSRTYSTMPKFLWTFKVLIKKPANTQIGCPFYVTCVFSLATYIIILFVMNIEGFHCNVILGINFLF